VKVVGEDRDCGVCQNSGAIKYVISYGYEEIKTMSYVSLLKSISFAAEKHSTQRRKDSDASPYINHPIAVATVLASEGNVDDEALLIAAVLHDTVEDTETTFEKLEEVFGIDVTNIVREVTDDKSLPKATRKELQIEHARHASSRAKQIKIADKICNIRDILNSPPADWSIERRQEYLEWTQKVVNGCRGVNTCLDQVYDDALAAGDKIE
jgi:guanosine-3',5'-bis(diphosphate) 3'-pyrophosphohydrolase